MRNPTKISLFTAFFSLFVMLPASGSEFVSTSSPEEVREHIEKLKERNTIGMYDFDLDYLQPLGFERFKLLRPRQGNQTGF